MNMRWKPNVTVAAVIERQQDGVSRFLLVEEHTPQGLMLNNPAGHLDAGESMVAACAREVLEETAHEFRPTALVGIYMARVRRGAGHDVTYLRFAFCGDLGRFDPARRLDHGIVRTLWLTADEIRANTQRHRSPMLLRGIDDYLRMQRYPLDLLHTDSSVSG
ncbi:MAG: NUDIX hydrolase [Burkholderiaceae bacterium]|nr:NUDIX hydrolase [Burkholderiaceae bacterium]MDO9089648.1 NUDIX hydrolase [Burkholderiaceae bacterium]MDP1967916.1 NUDIX hydrolase [Burkholderiaceae bacterium]